MTELKATAYAVTVEILCPACEAEHALLDPIPAPDGSFIWKEVPEKVTCPACKGTFKVKKRIRA